MPSGPTNNPGDRRHGLMVPTLNGMGYMITELDEVQRAFVEFAASAPDPVLDVGAAFGAATLAALDVGATVFANDVDPRHLDRLWESAAPASRERLTRLPGAFPDDVVLEANSLSAALLARVMHFFDGPQVEQTAALLHRALRPGGKVFATVDSSVFLDEPPLRRAIERRRQAGERWPGYIANVPAVHPHRGPMMPDTVHCLSPEILSRAFSEAGFEIERAEEFTRTLPDVKRRTVALIARKPVPANDERC